jgi:type VI secretion system protein ImpA
MLLREDLLQPISGDNPSGVDVKYLLYDKIQEARRQDDDLAQGDWQRERKLSNFPEVIRLAQEGLATRSKDLKIATWMAEALVHTDGFSGLRQGLTLCCGLIRNFWDTLYPPIEDGDLEDRAAPLEWLNSSTEIPLKFVPIVGAGYNWFQYKESRLVPYDDPKLKDSDKKLRAKKLAEGKLPPETIDKAFAETPKSFYLQAEKELDGCLAAVRELNDLCSQSFGDSAPSFNKLQITLQEIRHTIHLLLEKKRELEPDPVEPPPEPESTPTAVSASGAAAAPAAVAVQVSSSEPVDRRDAIASIAAAAAFLRKREPHSPAPYLMMRGLRWGELRAGVASGDVTVLEPPPTELRQQIKRLAVGQRWTELLESAEQAMSLPCSRAWLDLQRMVVEGCNALGGPYQAIAAAIQSELKALLTDLPQLLDASLMDDTPAANTETRAWLKQLLQSTGEPSPESSQSNSQDGAPSSWPGRPVDTFKMAREALVAGQPEKAFELLTQEIARQACGRGRFHRKLQLVQLCIQAGKEAVAQPLLDDLLAAIELHKLEDWEEKETVAEALAAVLTSSKKVQANAAEKQKIFDRICRLDPLRALGVSG